MQLDPLRPLKRDSGRFFNFPSRKGPFFNKDENAPWPFWTTSFYFLLVSSRTKTKGHRASSSSIIRWWICCYSSSSSLPCSNSAAGHLPHHSSFLNLLFINRRLLDSPQFAPLKRHELGLLGNWSLRQDRCCRETHNRLERMKRRWGDRKQEDPWIDSKAWFEIWIKGGDGNLQGRKQKKKCAISLFMFLLLISSFLPFFSFFFFVVEESFKWVMKTIKERRIFFMGRSSTHEKLKTDYLHGKIRIFFFPVLAVVLLLSVSCRNTPFFFNVFSSLSGVF